MSSNDHVWLRYAELQQRSRNTSQFSDYASGLECALDYLLHAIETGTVPPDPAVLEAALKRAIASGARLHRSRSLALKTWVTPPESMSTNAVAEARLEIARIGCTVKEDGEVLVDAGHGCTDRQIADRKVLLDAGFGYFDREIADRHASTPGAIRVRLSRLRLKLAAKSSSVTRPATRRKPTYPIYGVHGENPQPANQAAWS